MDDKMTSQGANGATPSKAWFGAIEEEYTNLRRAKVAIIPAPYDRTATYKKGTRFGPAACIHASKYLELYDDEINQDTFKIGLHTVESLPIQELEPEAMIEKVYAQTAELVKANKFPVLLGGEHSVSIGAIKAVKEAYPNLSVLHLDAHYDMRDTYFGSRYNHGCVARRIAEICPVVQAGVRSCSREEKDFLATQPPEKIRSISVYDILEMPLWKDTVSNSLSEQVYISIDLDVFDPALVPGVGTPEPGGLGWYEVLDLLKEVGKDKKIVGFDVVELCPVPELFASDFFAAKLIYRLLGYTFFTKK